MVGIWPLWHKGGGMRRQMAATAHPFLFLTPLTINQNFLLFFFFFFPQAPHAYICWRNAACANPPYTEGQRCHEEAMSRQRVNTLKHMRT